MPQSIKKLAILFADICGSTALYEEFGDDVARRMISRCLDLMSNQVAINEGALVKTIGDEIMCAFPSVETAFNAACAMQVAVRDNRLPDEKPMHIRIGFHYGDVILEAGDVFGDTVNTAARVSSITRASQIMTTPAVYEMLPPDLKGRTRHIMRTELKGKHEQIDIFLVIWDLDDSMTTRIMVPNFDKAPNENAELNLRYRGQSFTLNKDTRSLMLGRGDTCDIVVLSSLASRQHVRIELRGGKFVLIDQSTNGTFIHPRDGKRVHITREEMILHGKGTICLGNSYSDNPTEQIEYSVIA